MPIKSKPVIVKLQQIIDHRGEKGQLSEMNSENLCSQPQAAWN